MAQVTEMPTAAQVHILAVRAHWLMNAQSPGPVIKSPKDNCPFACVSNVRPLRILLPKNLLLRHPVHKRQDRVAVFIYCTLDEVREKEDLRTF